MKKVFASVLPAALSLVVCFSVFGARAGEATQNQVFKEPVSAVAVKYNSSAAESAAEKVAEKETETATGENTEKTAELQEVQVDNIKAPIENTAKQTTGQSNNEVVTFFDFITNFMKAFFNGMKNISSDIVDLGGEFPEFISTYDDADGNPQIIRIGMYFDEQNQLIIGKGGKGAFGFGFDVDLKQKMMYATEDIWVRSLGYSKLYDAIAPALGVNFKTERVKFEYDGLDWMIQIWKGKYFSILSGAEMGIYNKPQSREIEFYDCGSDEDMMVMSMRLSKKDTVLVERSPELHWWMTGFALSSILNRPEDLTLEGSIQFKDEGMKQAFLVAFDKVCEKEDISYKVDGMLVSYTW